MTKKMRLYDLYKTRKRGKVEFGDAEQELVQIRAGKAVRYKKVTHVSKLDQYAFQLRALITAGASVAELHYWLQEQGVKCARSTVYRWSKKYEEKDE
ncbi:hypothetical protein AB4254_10805 [Vibrio breoganii]